MRIGRKEFLELLDSVSPGLARKEIISQSNCFVFGPHDVTTFNDEVACCIDCEFGFYGAVIGKPLLDILKKLPDDELDISANNGKLLVKGKRRRASICLEQDVVLPVDVIDEPDDWKDLDPEFVEAIKIVHNCASDSDLSFAWSCVHIHTDFVEATDSFQFVRYPIKTGIETPIMVRKKGIKSIIGANVIQFCETESWIHFRGKNGLNLSCRRFVEDYSDLTESFEVEGDPVKLPDNLQYIVSRAEVFSENTDLTVELRKNGIKLEGTGPYGSYAEIRRVEYDGPNVRFVISPGMLLDITKHSGECLVSSDKIMVLSDKFTFAACLEDGDDD